MFHRRFVVGLTVVPALVLLAATPADARQCRPNNHMHVGQADGLPTKADARRSAIESWSSFTLFEYGAGWGSFRNARLKRVSCFQRDAGWSCTVEGNPCRKGGKRRRTARR